jgi:hypothetical protein
VQKFVRVPAQAVDPPPHEDLKSLMAALDAENFVIY